MSSGGPGGGDETGDALLNVAVYDAVTAAHAVLVGIDPGHTAVYNARRDTDLAAVAPGPRRDRGADWGARVGGQVLSARADDGSSSASDSLDYAAAFAEVAVLGDAAVAAPDTLATYQFWSLPAGTVQPAGEWLRIASTVASSRALSLPDTARLMALLSMALADTSVSTVRTKARHRHWRPTTAIREADTDGNPLTAPNPTWSARAGGVGTTPEWVSGHSSYSAAAAAEAGRSRVFGGQHFEFSNQAGLVVGRGVAAEVLRTRLLRASGPTHRGECPR